MSALTAKLIVFLPLLGAIIAGLFGHVIKDKGAQFITSSLLVLSAILSLITFVSAIQGGFDLHVFSIMNWLDVGALQFDWSLRFDTLTVVMCLVVTGVSSLVHIYSVGYMSEDKSIPRFMSYLSLFTFFMLMLVTSDNLVQMFFGWEGVGLASYLLIGFWYHKPSANSAAMKAFIVNRVGDFGFALGICGIFLLFGSVEFSTIFSSANLYKDATIDFLGYEVHALTTICILLFIGAMGKSAQLGLHTWLPDAMEGPTPVSALIHAATMVTAGVFMVARLSPVFEFAPSTLELICFVGATTAFFAASIGLTQNDIKRVIAYSTCSQLGYMFFALGVSAYGAAIFHLFTHAFFKALLFLGAGSVIHAMSHEQDMRKMGGIWNKIPFTYAMMWIGNLALAGFPFFAGYYSKDIILESAFASHTSLGFYAYWMGILAAVMTAFYSWRLLFMTFHGQPRASKQVMDHVHESPIAMTIPLFLLAIGAVFAGMWCYEAFVGHSYTSFWQASLYTLPTNNVLEHAHHVPLWVKKLPLVAAILGVSVAYLLYIRMPSLPSKLANKFSYLYAISYNKWFIDELYDFLFVRPSKMIGRVFWKTGDVGIIDRFGPNGVAAATYELSKRASESQTGYIFHYAFVMLVGLIIFISWFVFGGLSL